VKRAPLRPAGETIAAIQSRIAEIRAENDAQRRGQDADLSDARRALLEREAAVVRARSLSIVGERFLHRTFKTFERRPENAEALASARFSIADEPLMGVAFYGPPGVGKGSPFGTPVATPCGWRAIESLQVGDAVIGRDGTPTIVLGVFDRGRLPSFRVTMSDGSSVVTDGDHLWAVQTSKQRNRSHRFTIRSTSDLRKNITAANLFIPMVQPVQYPHANLPIEPYTLGVMLANGHLCGTPMVALNSLDCEIFTRVAQSGERHSARVSPVATVTRFGMPGIQEALRTLGLFGLKSAAKFIPRLYLVASLEQRVAILHGLMDCDGSARPGRSAAIYSTSSEQLAKDVRELIESLGGNASYSRYDRAEYGIEYRVHVFLPPTIPPFFARRKADVVKPSFMRPFRRIVSIEPAGDADIRCIRVAAADSLYVTERYIVTHNTHLAAAMAHEVIERGIPVVVDSVNSLLRRIRATFDAGVKLSEDEVVQRVASVPLLVLDDLGKEYLTPWAATTLWDISNARYERNLPLIVTSNSDLDALSARYSQRIAGLDEQTLPAMFDRVVEMVGGVDRFRAIGGDSRRAIVEAVR